MGRSPPIKPTKVTLFTIIWYNTENNFRDSMRLDYQILLKSPPPRRGHRGGRRGCIPTHQAYRGVDMTLNFIENHRQKYFCPAHYLISKDVEN